MKKIVIAFFFATLFCNSYAQQITNLKNYGIPVSIDTKGWELSKVDTTAKVADSKKVILLEFESFTKLYLLWLKPGKQASKLLSQTLTDVKKQKGIKIITQEKNALIVGSASSSVYKVFYATSIKGNQYFFQSGSVSEEKAKKLLEIAKSLSAN